MYRHPKPAMRESITTSSNPNARLDVNNSHVFVRPALRIRR